MASLTRKQIKALENVLDQIRAAQAYLKRPDVAVCHRSHGITTLDYSRSDGKHLYEVETSCGSDLCQLDTAVFGLSAFLSNDLVNRSR